MDARLQSRQQGLASEFNMQTVSGKYVGLVWDHNTPLLPTDLDEGVRSSLEHAASEHRQAADARTPLPAALDCRRVKTLSCGPFDSNQSKSSRVDEKFRLLEGFTEMRSYFVPAIAIAMIMPAILSARSDDIPTVDVRPVCRGIASQGELDVGLQQTSFEQCVQSEQAVREQLKKEWSTFSTADKTHCVALSKTGGESSYTELITCMEMARDVRAIRSAEATSSGAATTRTRSSPPTPAMQPVPSTPARTVPRPSSTNESPDTGADSTLKELTRVKADAQNARASEATVRGNLASAQAELQRTKEELERTKDAAGRATKEAEQAKADAQSAREAQARAENKLADAEAARSAAEERLKASESAAKDQQGFGARLRGWFGLKPSNP
jgi:hypothetical protein